MHVLPILADPDLDWIFAIAGAIFGLLIGVLISAVILRASCKWALKIDLDFRPACLISLLVWIINIALHFSITSAVGMIANDMHYFFLPAQLVVLAISLPIVGALYGVLIKDPDKYPASRARIGFGRGILVTLMSYLIELVVFAAIGALAFGIIMAMGGAHYLNMH